MSTFAVRNAGGVYKTGGGKLVAYDGTNLYDLGYMSESTLSVKDTSGKPESVSDESGYVVTSIPAETKIEGEFSGLLMQSDQKVFAQLMRLAKLSKVSLLYMSSKSKSLTGGKTQFIFMPIAKNKINYELKTGTKAIPFSFDLTICNTNQAGNELDAAGTTQKAGSYYYKTADDSVIAGTAAASGTGYEEVNALLGSAFQDAANAASVYSTTDFSATEVFYCKKGEFFGVKEV